ncbi:MAG: hypothetical protein CVV22_00165 [Ignavibacteriae bacterium HGW-Ignavibacteriae-1]|jgi:hypothetical protein|nr:MAG: hypothetical protein CVV22_00165 [Ignavibacteriae bacterium HGW-Ignavibacteriae-1]
MKIINEKLEVIMFNRKSTRFYLALLAIVFVSTFNMNAATINTGKNADDKGNDQERLQAKTYNNVYDLQQNSISNIQFYTTNYGIFGYDVARSIGGGYWPRGSLNQYIFAGGLWIGVEKYRNPTDAERTRYVSITYNPNSGRGWYVPGRINYGGPNNTEFPNLDAVDPTDVLKYRTYFSTDFIPSTGEPVNPDHQYYWPIWDASKNEEDTLKTNRYLGYFIPQTELRNTATHPRGPAFISGEDIFSTYKDTDLSRYEGGVASRRERGYPIRFQVDQMIYSWGFGDYKDFIFLKYEVTNYSTDTLWNCWLAPIQDVDIARAPATSYGAGNDRAKYFDCNDTLNMAVQWSNADRGEANQGFGYLGFDFLESPAVVVINDTTFNEIRDSLGVVIQIDTILTPVGPNEYNPELHGPDAPQFVRKDKIVFTNDEQLGLVTFRNWAIDDDRLEDEERYNFISTGQQDGDDAPGDKRFLMSTGPFHMRPGDTVRTVVGMILANSTKGVDADGTCDDMKELERKDIFAQQVYDNNFRAPTPPDRAIITNWQGLNHAVSIQWDNTSEMSYDIYEKGLDFMGYKIYRARRTNLDTFAINEISPGGNYPSGKGPFGWKQVAQYRLPPPFQKSQYRAGTDDTDISMPMIDDLRIIGPYFDANGTIVDSMAIKVMRIGSGMRVTPRQYAPVIVSIDTSAFRDPWGKYWAKLVERDPNLRFDETDTLRRVSQGGFPYVNYNPNLRHELFDSVLVGVAYLDRALVKFNPLLFKRSTFTKSPKEIDSIFNLFTDGIVGQWRRVWDDKLKDSVFQRLTTDAIWLKETQRIANIHGKDTTIIDIWMPRAASTVMQDTTHVFETLTTLYEYIKLGNVQIDFPEFEQSLEVRRDVIGPYMARVTNNRTFFDVGDDNQDGYISPDADPTKTEKLINNIDYFYKVLAYDEGDYQQPTPSKLNTSSLGLTNMIKTFPSAAPSGDMPSIQIIHVDSSLIGGLYNFRFFAVDNDRLIQKFEGDELILKFEPYWFLSSFPFDSKSPTSLTSFGLYRNIITLWSKNTGDTLYRGFASYESKPCDLSYYEFFTENAASYVLSDTAVYDPTTDTYMDFGEKMATGIKTRTGRFSSGDFTYPNYCYTNSWMPNAYGILGFSFDFTISQYAGRFRPDSLTLSTAYGQGVNANTPVNFKTDENALYETNPALAIVQRTMPVGFDFNTYSTQYGSFNNGPGIYEVEFLPGGSVDNYELAWHRDQNSNTFQIEYLDVKVKNIIEFKRPSGSGDSVIVDYPNDVEHLAIQPVLKKTKSTVLQFGNEYNNIWGADILYPNPANLAYYGESTNDFIGKYNIHAYGWISNSNLKREQVTPANIPLQVARPKTGMLSGYGVESFSGLPQQSDNGLGRYYKTAISVNGADTLDFTHIINISGVQFALDFANKGRTNLFRPDWVRKTQDDYNIWTAVDFKPGDKIYLRTYGGALGLPLPGATVIAKVGKSAPDNEQYSDGQLDGVSVVPNPYYISHEGVKSPYDSKIYFTKLPPRCTIQIYTVAGDLVNTLEHDEYQNEGDETRNAVQVWDLLSSNLQRVQSQTFVAVITTPNGAQTVKKFSVIVGGFRIIEQN